MNHTATYLRNSLREQRNNLPPPLRQQFDGEIKKTLLDSGILNHFQHIAGYLANDGEPSIDPFIQTCADKKRSFYLPVLNGQELLFSLYQWGDALNKNTFNIPEPAKSQPLPAKKLDLVLLPLVGFDSSGNRLGMGGGYYDRTLSFLLEKPPKKRPLLIGIAYSLQHVENLQRQPWDVPLDAVITENGVSCFTKQAKQQLALSR